MEAKIEIMLKSHDYLQDEILSSISWQNRFIIAVVPIISALLGLGLTEETTLHLLLVAIPPTVTIFTAFWIVEQSRMMRAGDFLQLLEDEINIKADGACILWENWLRIGPAGGVHQIYHISQYLGVIGMLYIVSGFSIWKTMTSNLIPLAVNVLYIAMLILMLVLVVLVVRHNPRERKEFKSWRDVYQEEWLTKDMTSDEFKQKFMEALKSTSQKLTPKKGGEE